jgi:hypothetical protein
LRWRRENIQFELGTDYWVAPAPLAQVSTSRSRMVKFQKSDGGRRSVERKVTGKILAHSGDAERGQTLIRQSRIVQVTLSTLEVTN